MSTTEWTNRLHTSAHEKELNALAVDVAAWRQFSVFDLTPPLTDAEYCGEAFDLVDAIAIKSGLHPLQGAWYEVDRQTAEWIIFQMFEVDLAYERRLMERDAARKLSHEFIRRILQSEPPYTHAARYFTNGGGPSGPPLYTIVGQRIVSSMSATQSTFDTGVIMVAKYRVGSAWGADED